MRQDRRNGEGRVAARPDRPHQRVDAGPILGDLADTHNLIAAPAEARPGSVEQALALAAIGFLVYPVRGKAAIVKGWPDEATNDPDRIGAWAEELRPTGWAILTGERGGVVVLDIDVRPEHDGRDTLSELEQRHEPLPETVTTLTPTGGEHRFFRAPSDSVVVSGPIADGLDAKGERGGVVGAGSRHPDGGTYVWEIDSAPSDTAIADAPRWLLELMGVRSTAAARPGHRGSAAPVSLERQGEFSALWRELGLAVEPARDRLYSCVWHEDRDPSLSINAEAALWHCFSCGRAGGLVELRRLSGKSEHQERRPGCPNSPVSTSDLDRGTVGTTAPRGQVVTAPPDPDEVDGCGRVMPLRDKRSGRLRLTRVRCDRRDCPTCGPKRIARYGRQLAGHMAGQTIHRVDIGAKGWEGLRKRIARAEVPYVRIPAPNGRFVVLTTLVFGEELADPETAALEALQRQDPTDPRRVSSSRSWRLSDPRVETESRWTVEGVSSVGMSRTIAAAIAVGAEVRTVPGDPPETIASWFDVDHLEFGSERWRSFAARVRLLDPSDRHEGFTEARRSA